MRGVEREKWRARKSERLQSEVFGNRDLGLVQYPDYKVKMMSKHT